LLEHGAEVNSRDNIGGSALLHAALQGKTECVQILLDRGSDPNVCTVAGQTVLIVTAAGSGEAETPRFPISKGAKPNDYDRNGNTALMYAAERGNKELNKLLIDSGADVNARNNSGETALVISGEAKHDDISELLKQAGAK